MTISGFRLEENWEKLNKRTELKNRKEIEAKMTSVFKDKIQMLPKDLQSILIDDMVTAFENRMIVFNRAQSGLQIIVDSPKAVSYETI